MDSNNPFQFNYENVVNYLATILIGVLTLPNLFAQTEVYVHPDNVIIDNFEGWGTSMAWWAEDAGDYHENDIVKLDELASMLINDLNFTTFRYNIGGSCDEDKEPNCSTINLGLNPQRTIPNMNEPDRGMNQRRMLKALAKIGKENNRPMKFETFSNSPPYWMLKSGSPTGGYRGANNLEDDKYEDFAEYLVRATRYINDDLAPFNFEVESIEPFNEPEQNWWKFNDNPERGRQEGCSFNRDNQIKMVNALYSEIQRQGVSAFINANDNYRMSSKVIEFYRDSGLIDKIGSRLNFHDYRGSIDDRKQMHALATAIGKDLWISEGGLLGLRNPGNGYEFQLRFMDRISKDLKYLRTKRWIDWQVMDTHPDWTAIDYYDYMDNGNLTPNKRFYMMQHFTKHITIGDDELFSTSDLGNVVAFKSADGNTLSIVIVNITRETQDYNINLGDFRGTSNGVAEYWLTDNTDHSHQKLEDLSLDASGILNVSLDPITIATFEVAITGTKNSSCETTTLTPNYDINNDNSNWLTGTDITVDAGTPLRLSPYSTEDGDWVWFGDLTVGTARQKVIRPSSSTTATATFTNICGQKSTITFNITVNPIDCPETNVVPTIYHNESWTERTEVIVNPGDLVRFGPQPESGTWSWSGCGLSTNTTTREPVIFPNQSCTVTATHTSTCGTQTTIDFNIIIGIPEGRYRIENRNSNKTLVNLNGNTSRGARVVQTTSDNSEDEIWIVTSLGNGEYSLQHASTGLYADIAERSTERGALNILWRNNNRDNQKWNIIPQDDNYYHIINVNSGLFLDITNASNADNAQNIQWRNNGGTNQDWTFIPIETSMARVVNPELNKNSSMNLLSRFSIYPNPTKDGNFKINIPEHFKTGTLEIFDISGRTVFNEKTESGIKEINASDLKNGMYLIKFSNNSQQISKRLVINK